MALQIRDVPDDVRRALAERAAASGQSLQALLLTLLVEEAGRSRNLAVLDSLSDRRDGSSLTVCELSEELDRARAERDRA